eukprot:423272_1
MGAKNTKIATKYKNENDKNDPEYVDTTKYIKEYEKDEYHWFAYGLKKYENKIECNTQSELVAPSVDKVILVHWSKSVHIPDTIISIISKYCSFQAQSELVTPSVDKVILVHWSKSVHIPDTIISIISKYCSFQAQSELVTPSVDKVILVHWSKSVHIPDTIISIIIKYCSFMMHYGRWWGKYQAMDWNNYHLLILTKSKQFVYRHFVYEDHYPGQKETFNFNIIQQKEGTYNIVYAKHIHQHILKLTYSGKRKFFVNFVMPNTRCDDNYEDYDRPHIHLYDSDKYYNDGNVINICKVKCSLCPIKHFKHERVRNGLIVSGSMEYVDLALV